MTYPAWGTLVVSVFTLVICLVVVALSGAAVLHVTLADQTKRATSRPPRSRGPAASPDPVPEVAGGDADEPEPEPDAEVAPAIEVPPEPTRAPAGPPTAATTTTPSSPPAWRGPAPASIVVETHRARSAGLLVVLLTTLGGVLALVVAVVAVVAVVGLRAALVG